MLKRSSAVSALLIASILLGGCSSGDSPLGSPEFQVDTVKIDSYEKVAEEYLTTVVSGESEKLSKSLLEASQKFTNEDKEFLESVRRDRSALEKVSPEQAKRIHSIFKGMDPAEKFYSKKNMGLGDAAILPMVSTAITLGARSSTQLPGDNVQVRLDGQAIEKDGDTVRIPVDSVSISSGGGEDIVPTVRDMFPKKIVLIKDGKNWLVDGKSVTDFFLDTSDARGE